MMEIPHAVAVRSDTGVNNARLGLWLFLASEAMLFGGLISAYAFLRTGAGPGEFGQDLSEAPLAGFNTLVLLASSLAMTFSLWSLRDKAFGRHKFFLGLTLLLGALFIGIKWIDYSQKFSHGLFPSTSTFLAIFFALTGVHALHVIGGMVVISYFWLSGHKLWEIEPEHFLSRVTVTAMYWNFVDAIWVILFILLYIL